MRRSYLIASIVVGALLVSGATLLAGPLHDRIVEWWFASTNPLPDARVNGSNVAQPHPSGGPSSAGSPQGSSDPNTSGGSATGGSAPTSPDTSSGPGSAASTGGDAGSSYSGGSSSGGTPSGTGTSAGNGTSASTPPKDPPPPSQKAGKVPLLHIFFNDFKDAPDSFFAAHDLVVAHPGTLSRVAAVRQLNPKAKFLLYIMYQGAWPWQADYAAINAHEDWFMHVDGRRTQLDPPNGYFLADIRNPAYRSYAITHTMQLVNQYNLDGVFWDGPMPVITGWLFPNNGLDPQEAATWPQDILVFLREFKQALGSKLLTTNSSYTSPQAATVPGISDDPFIPIVDGTMIEMWAHPPWWKYDRAPDSAKLARDVAVIQRNISRGKWTLLVSGSENWNDPGGRWTLFSYAMYLLFADEKVVYNYQDNTFPQKNYALGLPIESASSTQGGLWTRTFEKGKVLVNMSDQSQQRVIGLDGYRLPSGTPVKTIDLDPLAAVILLK